MTAAIPVLGLVAAHQAHVGLMHQRGGLEGLAWFLLGQLLGGEFAQFIVDQRQELLGSVRITLLDGRQDARNFTHGAPVSGHASDEKEYSSPGS